MLKIRLQGTKNDITWFKKIMERNSKIKINEFSDLFPNKGTNKYYRVYAEVSCLEVIEECRSVGIGRRIVELFLNEKSYNREDIIVEPLNEAAESFWNAVGIRCSLY